MRNNDYTFIEKKIDRNNFKINKKVSVIIPFYRGIKLLENTLTGLSNQTYPSELFEVIVSEDDTYGEAVSIVKNFSKSFKLSLIQRNREGFCVGSARNNGILNAQGEIIIIIDFDMLPPPNFIHSHACWYHISESLCVFGGRKFVDAKQIEQSQILNEFFALYSLPDINSVSNTNNFSDNRNEQIKYIKNHPYPFNCFHGCNISFLKRHAFEIGLFDTTYDNNFGFEDIDFGLRLWEQGYYIVYEKNALCLHQESNFSDIGNRQISSLRNLKILYQRAPKGYKEYRLSIGKKY